MKLHIIPLFAFLAGLGFCAQGLTQTVTERETEIHKNIRLIEVAVPKNIPADLVRQYRDFLPMFKETLKDVTRDQEYKDRLVIRVSAGIVEIGSSGVKYAQVRATSFCGNSKNEYVGNFLLHDFQTDGPVDREMTETFMRKQLLEPLQCYVPVARAAVPAKPRVVPEPAVVRIRVDPPMEKIEDTGQKRQSPVQPEAEPEAESEPEFELHKNVYLFTTDAEPDVPEDLAVQYRNFLPVLREIVRGNTRDQSEENRLIMRVAIGTREVGPGKTRRAHARITSLVGNSNREYINDFSLHSYASGGPVSKTEAAQFITKLILEPLECYAPSPLIDEVTKTKPAVVPVRASLAAEKIAKPAPAKSSVTKPAPVEQMKSDREIEVRKNVRLVEFAPTREIPGEIAEMYYAFLPLFEDVLKEHTRDQTDKDNMVIRIAARAREVGSAKTQYPQAQVIAFCRGSTEQYIGYFFLYDFATGGLVNREVTEQFLRKQILEPLKCYLPAADPAAGSQPEAPETQGK